MRAARRSRTTRTRRLATALTKHRALFTGTVAGKPGTFVIEKAFAQR